MHKKYEKTANNIIFHSEHHHKITLQYFFSEYSFIKVSLLTEYFTLSITYSPKKTYTHKLFLNFLENLHSKLLTNKQTNQTKPKQKNKQKDNNNNNKKKKQKTEKKKNQNNYFSNYFINFVSSSFTRKKTTKCIYILTHNLLLKMNMYLSHSNIHRVSLFLAPEVNIYLYL